MTSSRFGVDSRVLRPWLTGLLLLAGLVWGISWLLDTQQITRAADADDDEAGRAAATSSTDSPSESGSDAPPVPLAYLLPLGPEDEGFRVHVRGTVVGTPIAEGFWILTDEDEVIFARSAEPAAEGQDLRLTGTLHQVAAAEGAARAAQAELREAAGWKVHRNLYLAADPPARDTTTAAAGVHGAPRDTT
jgi:hypothetical protein